MFVSGHFRLIEDFAWVRMVEYPLMLKHGTEKTLVNGKPKHKYGIFQRTSLDYQSAHGIIMEL